MDTPAKYAHIPGWGADLDPAVRPSVPKIGGRVGCSIDFSTSMCAGWGSGWSQWTPSRRGGMRSRG